MVIDTLLDKYALLVTRRPCVIIWTIAVTTLGFVAVAFVFGRSAPDFARANKGFEPRGNELSGRLYFGRALETSQCAGTISALPNAQSRHLFADFPAANAPHPTCAAPEPNDGCRLALNGECDEEAESDDERAGCAADTDATDCASRRRHLTAGGDAETTPNPRMRKLEHDTPLAADMCFWPGALSWSWDVVLVFEPEDESVDLLGADALRGMCEMTEAVASYLQDTGEVECSARNWENNDQCCAPRSLGVYAAFLMGKSSCAELTDEDALSFKQRLQMCASGFQAGQEALHPWGFRQFYDYLGVPTSEENHHTWNYSWPGTPDCTEYNLVYDSFNALIDKEYLVGGNSRVRFTKVMLPYTNEEVMQDMHFQLLNSMVDRSFGGAKLQSYEMFRGGLKFGLFNRLLLYVDAPLIAVAFIFIYLMLWVYSGSAAFAAVGFAQVFLAVFLAYGLYMLVFYMPFFPFINLTGLYLCTGIGADDLFVGMQAFDDAIRAREISEPGKRGIDAAIVKAVIADAGGATFVTSITTAAAFFASAGSYITAIRCFGVFTGLVVMCDWIMMVSFVPALAVVYNRYFLHCCCERPQSRCCPNIPMGANDRHLSRPALGPMFAKFLTPLITHKVLRFVWLIVSVGLGVGFGVFYFDPGFVYPVSDQIQMLRGDSPFERYCCTGKMPQKEFWLGAGSSYKREVIFVWGLDPQDNSDPWDPNSYPTVVMQSEADLVSREAQQYFLDVCHAAKDSSWFEIANDVQAYEGVPFYPHNCTMEVFIWTMELPCDSSPGDFWDQNEWLLPRKLPSPCCGMQEGDFPYDPTLFKDCFAEYAINRARDSADLSDPVPISGQDEWALTTRGSGAWFDSSSGEIIGLMLRFPTSETYSNVHSRTSAWLAAMEAWTSEQMARAPAGLQDGFLSVPWESLGYYALQTGLAQSSEAAMYIALGVALGVLTLVTKNFIVALYTTVTVALIVLCVTGILIFGLKWEQGLMESIIISCGIGMACDFAAHLGYAYRQANFKRQADQRTALVKIAIDRMAPALTFAAFSTLVMGIMMCFSGTLFTLRFGIFISLLMAFGWFFAFFFLMPLLSVLGPLGNWGEIFPRKRPFPTQTVKPQSASATQSAFANPII